MKKDAYQHTKNCDDSWVVTTEGPMGPKCTESSRALIGRSARNRREREHKGSECKHVGLEYEHVGSAKEYVDSEEYERKGSARRVRRARRREVRILSSMKSTPTGRGQLSVSEGYGR